MVTIKDVVERGTRELKSVSGEKARLESSILLGAVLGVERSVLYIYPERDVSDEHLQQFLVLVGRRQQHEPIAYLIGHKEFYGLDFLVNRHVLIPRPETELLVEMALEAVQSRLAIGTIPVVADIGTGSGAIPITLAVKEPRLPYLYASDISGEALEVARANCQKHHVQERVRLLQGDLLAPLPEPVDILTANLPYIGTLEMETLIPDVRDFEPHHALFSGPDGLALIMRFFQETHQSGTLSKGAVMILELGYQHREPLMRILPNIWPDASIQWKKDYAGWDRFVQVQL